MCLHSKGARRWWYYWVWQLGQWTSCYSSKLFFLSVVYKELSAYLFIYKPIAPLGYFVGTFLVSLPFSSGYHIMITCLWVVDWKLWIMKNIWMKNIWMIYIPWMQPTYCVLFLQRDYGYDTDISYSPETNSREVGSCVERGLDGRCLRPIDLWWALWLFPKYLLR